MDKDPKPIGPDDAADLLEQRLFNDLQITSRIQKIAQTGYSKVYKAHSTKFACDVAIKVIDRSLMPLHLAKNYLPRELKVSQRVRHPHLLRSLAIIHVRQFTAIATEFCHRGSLISILKTIGRFDEDEAYRLFRQLIEALKYLHDRKYAHRDAKISLSTATGT
ncbi:hypothetical protein L596_030105 [Steinernema carpocapsae]|uniref:Protein kinase domain-containing protein n=1 Tax=Steinernema carpocapsae TaxID=34508 RepID=A0A4U5LRQ9_STECR|nr:hypothetical protein L596_030105 [Steinernema carpocapsae]